MYGVVCRSLNVRIGSNYLFAHAYHFYVKLGLELWFSRGVNLLNSIFAGWILYGDVLISRVIFLLVYLVQVLA